MQPDRFGTWGEGYSEPEPLSGLTSFEMLMFAAQLSLPASTTPARTLPSRLPFEVA